MSGYSGAVCPLQADVLQPIYRVCGLCGPAQLSPWTSVRGLVVARVATLPMRLADKGEAIDIVVQARPVLALGFFRSPDPVTSAASASHAASPSGAADMLCNAASASSWAVGKNDEALGEAAMATVSMVSVPCCQA